MKELQVVRRQLISIVNTDLFFLVAQKESDPCQPAHVRVHSDNHSLGWDVMTT